MLPVENIHGEWPASGEIDLMESQCKKYTYSAGGNQILAFTLHRGPAPAYDACWRTSNKYSALHKTFADAFNTSDLSGRKIIIHLHRLAYSPGSLY